MKIETINGEKWLDCELWDRTDTRIRLTDLRAINDSKYVVENEPRTCTLHFPENSAFRIVGLYEDVIKFLEDESKSDEIIDEIQGELPPMTAEQEAALDKSLDYPHCNKCGYRMDECEC
ncbi:unnamed protein product [marine sediment metagenome]|uniref:Uncharacterized protein n=1 Tax=marine sediment metagenome TaxID=412755 RepID=X1C6E8_9ZZZZ